MAADAIPGEKVFSATIVADYLLIPFIRNIYWIPFSEKYCQIPDTRNSCTVLRLEGRHGKLQLELNFRYLGFYLVKLIEK